MTASHTLIAVRGRDARVARWLESLAGRYDVLVLEGPRGIDPRRFGVPSEGSDWFLDVEGSPDPAGFGLGLAHLELVLLEREPGALLVGDGQGAALALALACCRPERLGAVVAVDAVLPALPEGAVVEVPLAGLPVLLVGRCGDSAARIAARGGQVTELALPLPDALDAAARWLGESAPDPRASDAPARG